MCCLLAELPQQLALLLVLPLLLMSLVLLLLRPWPQCQLPACSASTSCAV